MNKRDVIVILVTALFSIGGAFGGIQLSYGRTQALIVERVTHIRSDVDLMKTSWLGPEDVRQLKEELKDLRLAVTDLKIETVKLNVRRQNAP